MVVGDKSISRRLYESSYHLKQEIVLLMEEKCSTIVTVKDRIKKIKYKSEQLRSKLYKTTWTIIEKLPTFVLYILYAWIQ